MRRLAVPLVLCVSTLGLAGACTSHEGTNEGTPPPTTKPDPETPKPDAPPIARAAIASVQMIEDCPNQNSGWRPPPASPGPMQAPAAERAASEPAPSPGAPMPGAAAASRAVGGGPWVQPCTQSTMQLVFAGQGARSSKVEIQKVRLLDPKTNESIATIEAREPAAWADGAYQSWNETIAPHQEVKASYELSVPDWSDVERKIGTTSNGFMFVLELDVKVGDELQTVRSAQFPREMPHVIVT